MERMIASGFFIASSGMSMSPILLMPGSILSTPESGPIFLICCIWARKSSSVKSALRARLAMSSDCCASSSPKVSCAFSMSVIMSPMPRMREAMRSGWNGSMSPSFSPVPANLIGLPVTARTDSAAPPRVSPSSLVRITPVMPSFSLKVLATFTASWPVIASIVSRISLGATASRTRASSSMSVSSMCSRPAVSRITTSCWRLRANSTASFAVCTGSCVPRSNTGTPTCPPTTCSCLMAAGR